MSRLALLLAIPLWAAAPAERRIQIGIFPRADEISLVPRGRYMIADADGLKQALSPGQRVRLEPAQGGMLLGAFRLPAQAKLQPQADDAAVEIDGKRYRGTLLLRLDPGGETVTVVEELGIEDYLLGVLPYEMDSDWPLEALKAQAVVARTFAYTQLGKYRKDGFDLTTDTRSQVYGGRGSENAAVRKAVEGTRGEVLGYKGEILSVYYHACCGGHTSSPASIWGGTAPAPLRGVRDRYCVSSPLARWTSYVTFEQLAVSLQKRRVEGGPIKRLEIGARDAAGYVRTFVARVGGETLRVKAAELRAALGGDRLRSVRIAKIRRLKKGVEFVGGGSGHGVGLCQWGSRLQAQAGRRYEQILQFYFPGSTLSVVDE